MRQSSKKLTVNLNQENSLEKYLEQSKLKTQALKKLLKFIEDGDVGDKIPSKHNKDKD